MEDNSIKMHRGAFSQLLILLGIALISVAIFSFIPLFLAKPIFGLDALNDTFLFSQTENPQVIALLKMMQIFQSFGLFIVPPILLAFFMKQHPIDYLCLKKSVKPLTFGLMAITMLIATPAINWMGEFNNKLQLPESLAGLELWMKQMETEAEHLTQLFLKMNSTASLVFNIFMIALLPAIGEEFLFRGALQRIISESTKNKHLAVWISAVLFSAMHLQFYGFVPRMFLGAILGYSFLWTGSLWIPITGHFINNAAAVILSYLEQRGKINADIENIGAKPSAGLWVAFSFIMLGIFLYVLQKSSYKQETTMVLNE